MSDVLTADPGAVAAVAVAVILPGSIRWTLDAGTRSGSRPRLVSVGFWRRFLPDRVSGADRPSIGLGAGSPFGFCRFPAGRPGRCSCVSFHLEILREISLISSVLSRKLAAVRFSSSSRVYGVMQI